jgi:hypothetical protein
MNSRMHRRSAIGFLLACLLGLGSVASADTPPYMKMLVGHPATTKAATAEQNLLNLDISMFGFYDDSLRTFQKNLLAQHPVILALFTNGGGAFTLYRPGMAPVAAKPVPVVYQYLKSVAHATMAIFEIAAPHLDNPNDQAWRLPMTADRAETKNALDTLDDADMTPEWRDNCRTILTNNLAFMDAALAANVVQWDALQKFAAQQKPYLAKNISWAAKVQVDHWMEVVAGWKAALGSSWKDAYGVSNSIYVTKQNNILLSVLAQYFGRDAMNTRLMLFETTNFSTTADAMLELLTRVVADRSVGQAFFGNYYLMDYELMGGDARNAIIAAAKKRGMTPYLPPLVPFGSHDWPMRTTAGSGPGSIEDLH